MRAAVLFVLAGAAVGLGACAADDRDAIAAGRAVYAERCAACHDADRGIGPRLTPPVVRSYGSADALVDYLRTAMPYEAPGSLTDRQYRDITEYLLARGDSAGSRAATAGAPAGSAAPPAGGHPREESGGRP